MPYSCQQCERGKPCAECKRRRAERSKQRRAFYRAAGVCVMCGEPAFEPDATRCEHHREQNARNSLASHNRTYEPRK